MPNICVIVGRSSHTSDNLGLISQVADELWEVKGRKIKNLTKEDITIVQYKKQLVKNSEYTLCRVATRIADCCRVGQAALEKAKLFSKTAPKGKA